MLINVMDIKREENRLEMYKPFMGMFEPYGVVDIAFKTDENLTK